LVAIFVTIPIGLLPIASRDIELPETLAHPIHTGLNRIQVATQHCGDIVQGVASLDPQQ